MATPRTHQLIDAQGAPVANTPMYTVPSGHVTIVKQVALANDAAVQRTFSFSRRPAGGGAFIKFYRVDVAAGQGALVNLYVVLTDGQDLSIISSGANCQLIASGSELTL